MLFLSLAPPRGVSRRGSLGGCRACQVPCSFSWCTGTGLTTSACTRLLADPCRFLAVLRGRFWTLGCRVGERRTGGKKYILKKFVNAWSPRRLFLQDGDKDVVVSQPESYMTMSLCQRHWSEGWEVQRILYARDSQSGKRKVDVEW